MLLTVLVAGCAGLADRPHRRGDPSSLPAPQLELLATTMLPAGTRPDGVPVGGLSGLIWEPRSRTWLVVSDDPAARGPARLYRVEIEGLTSGTPGPARVREMIPLRRPDGAGFASHTLDPEDLVALPNGDILVSSEGNAETGIGPWVRRFSPEGAHLDELPIGAYFSPTEASGIRPNTGFEALTMTPDGALVIVGTEAALRQDGPANLASTHSSARLLVYDAATGQQRAEYVYRVDPLSRRPVRAEDTAIRGLTALLALDGDRMLSLEREYVAGSGTRVDLYLVSLEGAEDVAGRPSLMGLAEPPRPVRKRRILRLNDLGIRIDNLEGLAFGPELADGRRLLLMVSDDNFNPTRQVTQFLIFAMTPAPPL